MPWAGPGYRSDLADECGRGQNSLRRRLEALGWARLALPSPDDQSGTIAQRRAAVERQGRYTPRVGHQAGLRCPPYRRPEQRRPPYARAILVGWSTPALATRRGCGAHRIGGREGADRPKPAPSL